MRKNVYQVSDILNGKEKSAPLIEGILIGEQKRYLKSL